MLAPSDRPTTTAHSTPTASITAIASSANSGIVYAAPSGGLSLRPLPRPSNVTTRKCRLRYGTCAFQCREWTIDHVGNSTSVGSVGASLGSNTS